MPEGNTKRMDFNGKGPFIWFITVLFALATVGTIIVQQLMSSDALIIRQLDAVKIDLIRGDTDQKSTLDKGIDKNLVLITELRCDMKELRDDFAEYIKEHDATASRYNALQFNQTDNNSRLIDMLFKLHDMEKRSVMINPNNKGD